VPDFGYLPITEEAEVKAFLRTVPLVLDGERFTRFVLGFPHKYLSTTSPVDVVKHYSLMESLGSRAVISSLAREARLWKMCVVARDRSSLFSRIAGTLTCYGVNIVAAEAFANAHALVLDTFSFADTEGRIRRAAPSGAAAQAFLRTSSRGRPTWNRHQVRDEIPRPQEPLQRRVGRDRAPDSHASGGAGPEIASACSTWSATASRGRLQRRAGHVETPGNGCATVLPPPARRQTGAEERQRLGDQLRRLGGQRQP
jgi:hypothetical protein